MLGEVFRNPNAGYSQGMVQGFAGLSIFTFLLLTPEGWVTMYLGGSGAVRMGAAWFDDPVGDPILTALDEIGWRTRRRLRTRMARRSRESLEGPEIPDRLVSGTAAGIAGCDLVVVVSRAQGRVGPRRRRFYPDSLLPDRRARRADDCGTAPHVVSAHRAQGPRSHSAIGALRPAVRRPLIAPQPSPGLRRTRHSTAACPRGRPAALLWTGRYVSVIEKTIAGAASVTRGRLSGTARAYPVQSERPPLLASRAPHKDN
jgi:hypothetical protein